MSQLDEDLRREIKDGRAVVLVGSGVSIGATGRAPNASWTGLLREGVGQIEALHRAPSPSWAARQLQILEEAETSQGDLTDLLSVAEQVADRLGAPDGGDWRAFLRRTISELPLRDESVLRAIADLGVPILTTNYDQLLEKVTRLPPVTWQDTETVARVFRRQEQRIVHLHGFWEQPPSVVLGIRAYEAVKNGAVAQLVQKALATFHSIVFIGCGSGLADPNFEALRVWMRANLGSQEHRHYRLCREGDLGALVTEHPREERIQPLAFGEKHEDLAPYLRGLLGSKTVWTPTVSADPPPQLVRPRGNWPADIGIDPPDSLLLRPEMEVVPFHAIMHPARDEIVAWALSSDRPIELRLQAGPGGAGKTRLAMEVGRLLAEKHAWIAGFLPSEIVQDHELRELLADPRPCLAVLDYAEARSAQIAKLVTLALRTTSKRPLRLLLLARDGGDWWRNLAAAGTGDPVVEAVLRDPSTKTGPFRLAETPLPEEARREAFDEAVTAFGARLGNSATTLPALDLTQDHFSRPLFIHLAALAAVRGTLPETAAGLIDAALGHERSYWRRMALDGGGDASSEKLLAKALALVTLVGGTTSMAETRQLFARCPGVRDCAASQCDQLAGLLRRLYVNAGGIRGLEPDLLGERLVASALDTDDELLDVALGESSTSAAAQHALTVLTRLARHGQSQRHWLEQALARHGERRASEATQVALEIGPPLPEALASLTRAAKGAPAQRLARKVRAKLPNEVQELLPLAMAAVERQIEELVQEDRYKKGAKIVLELRASYDELATHLEAAGRLDEAVKARRQAFAQATRLAKSGHARDRARLAGAANNLGAALNRVGAFGDALEKAQQGEASWRELAQRQPDAYRPDWATSLSSLAAHLHHLGRYDEALERAQQGEAIRRELAQRQPDAYRPNWATSLTNLAEHLRDLGRYDEALGKA